MVHELATNSLKYGALSVPEGVLDISCDPSGDAVTIVWTEQGGPPVRPPSGEAGYGSKLVAKAMAHQLGGSMDRSWNPDGVVVTLRLDKSRLAV